MGEEELRGAAETLEDEISTDLVELVDQLCDCFETGYDNNMICVVVVDTKATARSQLTQWKLEDGDVVVFGCGRAMDTSRWAMGTCTCLRKHHEKPALVVARHQKKLWTGCGNRCLHAGPWLCMS